MSPLHSVFKIKFWKNLNVGKAWINLIGLIYCIIFFIQDQFLYKKTNRKILEIADNRERHDLLRLYSLDFSPKILLKIKESTKKNIVCFAKVLDSIDFKFLRMNNWDLFGIICCNRIDPDCILTYYQSKRQEIDSIFKSLEIDKVYNTLIITDNTPSISNLEEKLSLNGELNDEIKNLEFLKRKIIQD